MRNSNQARKAAQPEGDLYRAFVSLDPDHRRTLALRILRNERLLADLYDHFLIQRAFDEGGRNISWAAYKRAGKTVAS